MLGDPKRKENGIQTFPREVRGLEGTGSTSRAARGPELTQSEKRVQQVCSFKQGAQEGTERSGATVGKRTSRDSHIYSHTAAGNEQEDYTSKCFFLFANLLANTSALSLSNVPFFPKKKKPDRIHTFPALAVS